jgi:hypothetical protein
MRIGRAESADIRAFRMGKTKEKGARTTDAKEVGVGNPAEKNVLSPEREMRVTLKIKSGQAKNQLTSIL